MKKEKTSITQHRAATNQLFCMIFPAEAIVKVNNFELLINEKKLVKYRDKYLKIIGWSPIEDEGTLYHGIWIEGIGSPLDLMNNTPIWYDGCPYKELVMCILNDQIIYDKDDFEASVQVMLDQEYYPEGTKWTEIRLDTLKYDNWYSEVGNEWAPNFETIEYYVQGEYLERYDDVPLKCVYTNGPTWTDSLSLLVRERMYENTVEVNVPLFYEDNWGSLLKFPCSAEIYQFDWSARIRQHRV